jgi:hypothetical protein
MSVIPSEISSTDSSTKGEGVCGCEVQMTKYIVLRPLLIKKLSRMQQDHGQQEYQETCICNIVMYFSICTPCLPPVEVYARLYLGYTKPPFTAYTKLHLQLPMHFASLSMHT